MQTRSSHAHEQGSQTWGLWWCLRRGATKFENTKFELGCGKIRTYCGPRSIEFLFLKPSCGFEFETCSIFSYLKISCGFEFETPVLACCSFGRNNENMQKAIYLEICYVTLASNSFHTMFSLKFSYLTFITSNCFD